MANDKAVVVPIPLPALANVALLLSEALELLELGHDSVTDGIRL